MLNLNHTDALRELLCQILVHNDDGVRGLTTLSFFNALQVTLFLQFARIDMHNAFTNEGHRRLVASNGSNVGVHGIGRTRARASGRLTRGLARARA